MEKINKEVQILANPNYALYSFTIRAYMFGKTVRKWKTERLTEQEFLKLKNFNKEKWIEYIENDENEIIEYNIFK